MARLRVSQPYRGNHERRKATQTTHVSANAAKRPGRRARGAEREEPSHFIVLGVGFTAAFVLAILGVVKLVLYLAGL
jgi:hypothetical protein